MTIDLNKNGKDDIEELLEDVHKQFEDAAGSTEAIVKEFVDQNIVPVEEALNVDINGDGVIGTAR